MQEKTSEKIISKIKKSNIVPESKLKLNWKNYAYWAVLALMVAFGAIFLSLIFLNYLDLGGEVFRRLHFAKFLFLFIAGAPIFWIVLLLLALVSGVTAFHGTKHGYRYRTIFIAALVVLLVSVLGVAAHFSKISDRIEKGIAGKFPNMRGSAFGGPGRFVDAEKGILAGKITELDSERIEIETPRGEKWSVAITPKTKMPPWANLKKEQLIIIIGEKKSAGEFEAEFIKLPHKRGHFGNQGAVRIPKFHRYLYF